MCGFTGRRTTPKILSPSLPASCRYASKLMDFQLNSDQQKLVAMVRDFCVREVRPQATEWDREERFPREIVSQLGELGLLGMTVPEELGGSALDTLSVACVVEEIARCTESSGCALPIPPSW